MRKVFIHSAELDRGGYPADCPFNSRRAGKTRKRAESLGLLTGDDRRIVAPSRPRRKWLERFHKADYLETLQAAGKGEITPEQALGAGLGTPDCPVFRDMYEYTTLAAGGTVTGADMILSGEADMVFNPSGGFHHAQPDHAAGFCFINDIVLAAERFIDAGKRVAFLDIDVHHCDGVQDRYYQSADIMTLSMHESGSTLFPGTGTEEEIGTGAGRGYSVNLPLPVGTYDTVYMSAFREAILPLLRAFDPEIIMLELGMDTLAGDPLAHLHLTNNAPSDIIEALLALDRPLLVTGGGGYNIENTVRSWTLCWSVLCGDHSHYDDLTVGMGGVMLENTDWSGGLRDRVLLSDAGRRETVERNVRASIDRLRVLLFPLHGI